jgi:AcrR family transcriptional regulator
MPAARRRAPDNDRRDPSLSRSVIVSAALEMMDLEGVDRFSMRKLATRLEVSPQALYWHFSSKDDLCRAVVELVRDETQVELEASLPPAERVRALMVAMRTHLARHPSATDLGRRFYPPMAGALTELGIESIQSLGIEDRADALRHYRALVWTVTGFALVEHGATMSVHHRPVPAESTTYEVRLRGGRGTADGAGEAVPMPLLNVDELFATVADVFVSGLQHEAAARQA